MIIRQENNTDFDQVFNLIENAFRDEIMSDHKEQFLVERLRNSESFVPELSIVAEIDDQIVGYILLTKIAIKNDLNQFESLALAPVAVLKKYQNKGIGSSLIRYAHKKAIELNFKSVILLGHEKYYPKFGYVSASKYKIRLPFEVPDENAMALELIENSLSKVNGEVVYPEAFFQ